MTRNWIILSTIYILSISIMLYGVIKTKGFIQVLAIAGAVVLILVYSRMRNLHNNRK